MLLSLGIEQHRLFVCFAPRVSLIVMFGVLAFDYIVLSLGKEKKEKWKTYNWSIGLRTLHIGFN